MKTSRNYRLTVYCNPHDSFRYYHDEEILKINGRTPVEWIVDGCDSLTLDEAKEKLEEIVSSKETLSFNEEENAWYDPEITSPVYIVGADTYRDDVLFYSIEEIEEVEQ